jgi:hypothetical protein
MTTARLPSWVDAVMKRELRDNGPRNKQTKERVLGGARSVKFLDPEYSAESMVKMIECMTE